MHAFVRNLISEWRRLKLPTSGTVVIGVSGGADSISLLLAMHEVVALKKLDFRLVAAHYNHHLRDGESDADEQFVREITAARKIEFAVGHADGIEGSDLEQKARDARYAFLRKAAESVEAFAVLTGHTMNDQAETFLINLLRGSGPTGLCGMKAVRPLDEERLSMGEGPKGGTGDSRSECDPDQGAGWREKEESPLLPFAPSPLLPNSSPLRLVRPLLTWAKRIHTEGYCRDRGVEYRYDTMNEDTAFKRVRVRKILLPLLEDFNPNIVETLSRTASLMQDIPNPKPPADEDTLDIADLRAMSPEAMKTKVRAWLDQKRGNTRAIGLKHIDAIERLVKSQRSGRVAELPGKAVVIRSNGRLTYRENNVD
ncbi:MAG: tRNA lysidine(34) synthetase TilS [Acidobacteria bacterium]|nr:tRNA lysidine(34) synthetase TilS [Acidobacteriota bacterium]